MNPLLSRSFKIAIEGTTESEFQRFVTQVFLKRHGSEGFLVTREHKDRGCDGIVVGERSVVAVYGPVKYERKAFEKKASDDFSKYQKHWENEYPVYKYVCNHDWAPEQVSFFDKRKPSTIRIGSTQLIDLVDELDSYHRISLAKLLRLAPEVIAQDFLREVLDDLLRKAAPSDEAITFKGQTEMREKLLLNVEFHDVEPMLEEYVEVAQYFPQVRRSLSGYSTFDMDAIKNKIRVMYNGVSGDAKLRLERLTDQLSERYGDGDDGIRLLVRTLLIYHFEQCIIGRKRSGENAVTSS
jgi:hypothetical protein